MTRIRDSYYRNLHRTNLMLGSGQIAELRRHGIEASSVVRALLDAHLSILRQTKGGENGDKRKSAV